MKRVIDGKTYNIPQAFIDHAKLNLDLDVEGAVNLWLSDEGVVVNEEIVAMTAKAKNAGAGAKASGDKPKRKAPERKADEVKRAVIAALAEFIGSTEHVTNVEVTNIERMIAFSLGDDKYEVTLTKKRAPKE